MNADLLGPACSGGSRWSTRLASSTPKGTPSMAECRQPLPYDTTKAASGFGLGLHHVQLAIPPGSEAECREFYVDVLGMTEIQKPPELAARGGLWMRSDRLEIHLGADENFRPARKAHPGILVEDLDGMAKRLTAKGVEIIWDDNFPGHRRFYIFDVLGNRLEFLSSASTPRTAPDRS
jgi:catechol 2,3-dioxygenase-like lactoylglutathione lyase family enzyme